MDPSVRDDGDPEPDLQLAADPALAEPSTRLGSSGDRELARDRLLARAQSARGPGDEGPVSGGLDEIGRPEGRDPALGELETLGSALGRRVSTFKGANAEPLSPTLIAVFGTLIGVATVMSLIALMINIDRHRAAPLGPSRPSPNRSASSGAQVPKALPPPVAKRVRQKLSAPWRITESMGDPKLRWIEGKVGSDPFIKALTAAGVPEKEGYRVLTAMKGVKDFDKCAKSDRFSALIDRASTRLKAFEYAVSAEEIYQAREGDDGLLKGLKLDLKVEHNQVTGAVVYDGHDFDASAERAGFDSGLGHVVALALQGHLAMDELERGDRLRVVAQEVTLLGDFTRYTGVEALQVQRANPKREALRIYYFDDPKLRGYFDGTGKSPDEGGWRKPIAGAPITSPFNPRRMHPILHKIMPHLGTDIGAPLGTPVGAAAPGTVSYIGPGGPAGNLLKVMHENGIETGYAHLSRYASGLKVGDKVGRLQTIGYVGSTGRSTGPHLHFSAQRDGKFFDAETLNLDGMRVLNDDQRQQFAAVVAKYDPLLDAIPLPPPLPGAAVAAPEAEPALSAAARPSPAEDPALAEHTAESEAPAAPDASAVAAPKASGNAVYLSDKELLKMQSATDEGEVSE